MSAHGRVSIKLYLWIPKFELGIIFIYHKILLSLFFFWFPLPQLFKHVKNTLSSLAMWEQVTDSFVTYRGRKSPRPWISLWELAQPLTNSTNMAHDSHSINGCYESGKQVLCMIWARRLRAQCTFLGYNFKSVVLTLTRHLRYQVVFLIHSGMNRICPLFHTFRHFISLFSALPPPNYSCPGCLCFSPRNHRIVGACVSCGCHLTPSPLALTDITSW